MAAFSSAHISTGVFCPQNRWRRTQHCLEADREPPVPHSRAARPFPWDRLLRPGSIPRPLPPPGAAPFDLPILPRGIYFSEMLACIPSVWHHLRNHALSLVSVHPGFNAITCLQEFAGKYIHPNWESYTNSRNVTRYGSCAVVGNRYGRSFTVRGMLGTNPPPPPPPPHTHTHTHTHPKYKHTHTHTHTHTLSPLTLIS